jgi:3'-5' exoribonuclease 1
MFLIIDFEATCWDKNTDEGRIKSNRNENEIIEIGNIIVDDNYKIISSPSGLYVRPKLNPVLSEFCTQLTGIKQSQVDNALDFVDAMKVLKHNVHLITDKDLRDMVFCSWGFYDQRQLTRDCERNDVEYPFNVHRSLKHEFAERHKIKPCGMVQALKMLNIELEGHHHSGCDDAYNIAKIFIREWSKVKE